jgi:hypothetical protein
MYRSWRHNILGNQLARHSAHTDLLDAFDNSASVISAHTPSFLNSNHAFIAHALSLRSVRRPLRHRAQHAHLVSEDGCGISWRFFLG